MLNAWFNNFFQYFDIISKNSLKYYLCITFMLKLGIKMSTVNTKYTSVKSSYRKNGFQWPPNLFQFIMTFDVLFSCVLSPLTIAYRDELYIKVVYFIIFIPSVLGTVLFWYRASSCDPTDPVVVANRAAITENKPFDSSRYENMCTICNTSVGENSKHCGTCNRCVNNFDHHCIWLNNCVGVKNYRDFIKLLIIFLCLELTIAGFTIKQIIDYFSNDLPSIKNISNMAVEVFLIFQSCILILFVTNLIGLHIWLRKNGITTYEFIKRKNKRTKSEKGLGKTQLANSNVSNQDSPKVSQDI